MQLTFLCSRVCFLFVRSLRVVIMYFMSPGCPALEETTEKESDVESEAVCVFAGQRVLLHIPQTKRSTETVGIFHLSGHQLQWVRVVLSSLLAICCNWKMVATTCWCSLQSTSCVILQAVYGNQKWYTSQESSQTALCTELLPKSDKQQ